VAGCARFKAPSNRLGIELMKWIIFCAVKLFSHEALFVFVTITVFRVFVCDSVSIPARDHLCQTDADHHAVYLQK
jgi:hypothetical protein